ncbi:MAG: putative transposase/invertase (TIGR01784 family) [Phenylobacterium sp.]|jgi:predicted transposase/invertase (TIGR01784 family)
MQVFINPYTDYGFKKLFGEEKNKHLLISFLNDLLGGEEQVTDLTFQNTEHLPDGGSKQRKAVFDIYCTNAKDEHFIVELQKAKQNYFKDRTVFYSTFPIQQQAKKGDWDFNLKAVYCIGILDFVFSDHKDLKDIIHTVQLKNQHNQLFYDKLKYIYIEMPNFNKTLEQLENHCDRWLYFIKNLDTLEEIPELFRDDIIYKGFEVARIAALNKKERASYESSLKEYRDLYSVMKTAKQEGIIIGEARGEARGEAKAIESVAITMLNAGMPDEQIATLTKLSIAEVAAIRAKLTAN